MCATRSRYPDAPGLPTSVFPQFTHHLFKLEQQEYESEGVDWTKVEFIDNQECVDVFETMPPKARRIGIAPCSLGAGVTGWLHRPEQDLTVYTKVLTADALTTITLPAGPGHPGGHGQPV